MLNFYRINNTEDAHFEDLYNLYINAFPLAERRSRAGLIQALETEDRFCAYALMQHNNFAGLFNFWTFETFYYIEHLAVVPSLRSQRIGTDAMKIFMTQVQRPVVLEVELPTDQEKHRRIEFYQHFGFKPLAQHYEQPPYENQEQFIPLKIMSSNPEFANAYFESIRDTLYREVYQYKGNSASPNVV
jgi:ribosomal protein S18 acetylase RimI-like enzyme